MKLYDIPRGSKIKVECSDNSKYIIFDHIDGMYSYCTTEKGAIVHLGAVTPLKKVKNHYEIVYEAKRKDAPKPKGKDIKISKRASNVARNKRKDKPKTKGNIKTPQRPQAHKRSKRKNK